MENKKIRPELPLISILIPVRDDLDNLSTCLESMAREDYSETAELLVCDDGSREPLRKEILERIIPEVKLFRIKGSGPAKARNHLAERAKGKYLFFVDADTEFSGRTIRTARQIAEEHPDLDAFIGSYDDDPGVKTTVSVYKNLSHHYVHHQSAGRVSTFWTGCGVIRRQTFLEFGGFNEHYDKPSIEDIELGMRLAKKNRRVQLFPELQVKHNKAWTLSGWLKTDLLLRGSPWVRLMKTRNQWLPQLNFTWSHKLSAGLVLLLIPGIAASLFYPLLWAGVILMLLIFIVMNLRFFSFLAEKAGALRIPPMILLHMLYYLTAALSLALGLLSALAQGPLEEGPPPPRDRTLEDINDS